MRISDCKTNGESVRQTPPETKIILASNSPRRRELLAKLGVEFVIDAADVNEDADGTPREMVCALAARKGSAVAKRHREGIVIAADTLVALGECALGKPADDADAFRMLRMLSGRAHDVYTGVSVTDVASGYTLTDSDRTRVMFRALTDEEIDRYVQSGEPRDKAGAYAIQGLGHALIAGWEGAYDNVIGLPCALLSRMLDALRENRDGTQTSQVSHSLEV